MNMAHQVSVPHGNKQIILKAVVLVCFIFVAIAQACPPEVEKSCTVRGPGGEYGYMHLSYGNQMGGPGEALRIHRHVIMVGRWSFDLTGRSMLGFAGLLSVVGVICFGWSISRHEDNAR